jgi:hypothetical protein
MLWHIQETDARTAAGLVPLSVLSHHHHQSAAVWMRVGWIECRAAGILGLWHHDRMICPVRRRRFVRIPIKRHAAAAFGTAQCIAHHRDGLHRRLVPLILRLHRHNAPWCVRQRALRWPWRCAAVTARQRSALCQQLLTTVQDDVKVCGAWQRGHISFIKPARQNLRVCEWSCSMLCVCFVAVAEVGLHKHTDSEVKY